MHAHFVHTMVWLHEWETMTYYYLLTQEGHPFNLLLNGGSVFISQQTC